MKRNAGDLFIGFFSLYIFVNGLSKFIITKEYVANQGSEPNIMFYAGKSLVMVPSVTVEIWDDDRGWELIVDND